MKLVLSFSVYKVVDWLIFITGGVRSGKSALAEQMISQCGLDKHYHYIATGVPFDEEMKSRIHRHRMDRENQLLNWHTIEMQVAFPENAKNFSGNDVLLFECVTTWLSNVMYAAERVKDPQQFIHTQIALFQQQLLFWQERSVKMIIVSNEILDEPASKYDEVNQYRKLLGGLHQWLVKQSEEAYEVQFQLVQRWK